MTEAFLVIHSGPDGLYPAPAYYAAFPQEPSPFGMLTFTQAKTAVMGAGAASLFVAVQELAKAGTRAPQCSSATPIRTACACWSLPGTEASQDRNDGHDRSAERS